MTKKIIFVNKHLLWNNHLFVCNFFLHICHLKRFRQAYPNTILFCCCKKSELVIVVTCFVTVIKLKLFCYCDTNGCTKLPQMDALKYNIWPNRDKTTQIETFISKLVKIAIITIYQLLMNLRVTRTSILVRECWWPLRPLKEKETVPFQEHHLAFGW